VACGELREIATANVLPESVTHSIGDELAHRGRLSGSVVMDALLDC